MSERITRERLDFLLDNWAKWQRSERERIGPKQGYITVDRLFSWRPSGGGDTAHDEALALRMEEAVLRLVLVQQQALVGWYCQRRGVLSLAQFLNMSCVSAEAVLDTALCEVWRIVEESAWTV